MTLEEVVRAIESNHHLQASPDQVKAMLARVDQEMRDEELYGGDYPEDFPYDVNDLLEMRGRLTALQTNEKGDV